MAGDDFRRQAGLKRDPRRPKSMRLHRSASELERMEARKLMLMDPKERAAKFRLPPITAFSAERFQ